MPRIARVTAPMRYRPPVTRGTCVYCATADVEVEDEHVFPESWYPDDVPSDRMLIVPSCTKCNRDYGRQEDRVLARFIIGFKDDRTDSILERVIRSMDPDAAKSAVDREHRTKRRDAFFADVKLLSSNEPTPTGTLWTPDGRVEGTFTTSDGRSVQATVTIKFDGEALRAVAGKFFRGTFYAVRGRIFPAELPVEGETFTINSPMDLVEEIKKFPTYVERGEWPFEYGLAHVESTEVGVAWFRLWDR
jgi:hypothetical protein